MLCLLHETLCPQSRPLISSLADFKTEIAHGQRDRQSGNFEAALQHYHVAAQIAAKNHQAKLQAQALLYASGSEIRLFRYRSALGSADSASLLAKTTGDNIIAGAAASNIATIYSQLGENVLAEQASREAVSLLQKTERKDYLVQALINEGDCRSNLKEASAAEYLQDAVYVSRQAGLKSEEALAQDHLALLLIDRGDNSDAARVLNEARSLQTELHDQDGLAVTELRFAELSLKEKNYQEALKILDRALLMGGERISAIPSYWPQQLRGEILAALGRKSEALASLAKAVRTADIWRRSALPGEMTSTQTVATLDSVYHDFVGFAAELSRERRDPALARRALAVLVESRAVDLRDQMTAALQREMQLPPRYFELLSQLQAAESKLLASATQTSSLTEPVLRIRNELAALQDRIGISQLDAPAIDAKTRTRNLVFDLQHSLSGNQLLLSFSVGKRKSYLWAVSMNRVELYELPSENVLASHAHAYFSALQKGPAEQEGALMKRDLLGKLNPVLTAKEQWLIAADDVLLDQVPFAALPVISSANLSERLVVSHSFRFLPSELLLLSQKPSPPKNRFIGVADPIYNRADARLPRTLIGPGDLTQTIALARLPGSGVEVRAAAKSSGMSDIQLLTGVDATEAKLLIALKSSPEVLHFAVHVLSPDRVRSRSLGNAGDQALVLSLTPNGLPELLTKEAIAGLRVPGSLVVLSGCASQQGEIVPSAGLIGLGRAWLLAGAAAVIVTSWPTLDDSGGFFSEFYNRLKALSTAPLVQRASTALQQTQIAMQRRADYQSAPSFWAAYSLISDE